MAQVTLKFPLSYHTFGYKFFQGETLDVPDADAAQLPRDHFDIEMSGSPAKGRGGIKINRKTSDDATQEVEVAEVPAVEAESEGTAAPDASTDDAVEV